MKIIKISALWCPSCILMTKVFNQLKCKYPTIEFVEYDYDLDEEKIKKYDPGKVLPVFIFEEGRELERMIGEHSYLEIETKIKRYFNEKDV